MKDLYPIIQYLKRYRKKLIIGFFFVITTVSLQSYYPLVIGEAIDELTNHTGKHSLEYYSLLGVSLVALSGVFLFLTRQNIIVVSREIENDLRFDFFSHIQYLSKNFFDTTPTGEIMARATNDINNVRNFLGPGIMYSIQTFFRVIVTITILLNISVEITLYALIPLPLISIMVYRVMKVTYNRSKKVQEAFASMTTKAQENFSGIRVIKSYVREKFEINDFVKISEDYQKKNLALARMQAYSFPMMFLLTGLSVILVVYFGGVKVINNQFTYGNIAEFVVYLGQLTFPMIAFGWIINLIQVASPSMNRLMKIMNTRPEIVVKDKAEIKELTGDIEFRNVSFRYSEENPFVIKNLNLKIPNGTSLGIVGYTGSGKSTLINLICRLYDVSEGEILIDKINIQSIDLNILRRDIGVVPQESFLFSDSIASNIAYSSDTIEKDLMEESAKTSGLYKDIITFPDKFFTQIGERGITLSGGQKQRAAIARALYKNPKIIILDDSLSAVDTNTEEEILNSLKNTMKDRTSLIISHRISTLKSADKIIVIDKNKIAEEGTHKELLNYGGIYFGLYEKQLLEEEIREL